tara:strand:- start:1070 stop:1447 length:378 start_codon:yes stop_codon:yes gene_type:complete
MKKIEVNNLNEYFEIQIDLFTRLICPKNKLSKTLKKFLILMLIMNAKGEDINTRDATIFLRDAMSFQGNEQVAQYKYKLREKKWMIRNYQSAKKSTDSFLPFFTKFKASQKFPVLIEYIGNELKI